MIWGAKWSDVREKDRVMADDEWRRWYAWHPINFEDGRWAWLTDVEFNQPMRYNVARYRECRSGDRAEI